MHSGRSSDHIAELVGIIRDFVMLNALANTAATRVAIALAHDARLQSCQVLN